MQCRLGKADLAAAPGCAEDPYRAGSFMLPAGGCVFAAAPMAKWLRWRMMVP
jgi:hypothetical protein